MKKTFFNYMVPSVMAMWVFSIYTMVDGMFVGRGVGPTALAAVNISMPYINFIFALSLLFTTGTSTLVAIKLGKGEKQKANSLFTMNIFLLSVISLVIITLSLLNLEKLAIFLGATEPTLQYVKDYLGIIISFSGFFIVSYSLEVLVKTDGHPRLATLGVCIAAVINIVLDYIFVIELGFGIKGAAYATGISQALSIIMFLVHFLGKNSTLKFSKFKVDFKRVLRIIQIGIPDCITEFSAGIVIFLFNLTILRTIGETGIVTYTVISYVNTLVLMTMIGISQGMQPLVSFNYGKKERKNILYLLKISIKSTLVASLISFIVTFVASKYIVSAFISSNEVELFNYSINALKLFSISFLFMGFNVLISGFYVAIEKPKYSMIISLGRGLFIVLISLLTMSIVFGETGIWLATAVSEFICLLISAFLLKRYALRPDFLLENNNNKIS